jgi:tRNA threonylcarbamoyladenosine biosynthesis protein TsaB
LRILAIETSDRQFSVAALDDDYLLSEVLTGGDSVAPSTDGDGKNANRNAPLIHRQTSAPSVAVDLFPLLEQLLKQVNWRIADIELIAVSKGPGSFTGLRSGIVAAKVLAFIFETPIVAVNTLRALAFQCSNSLLIDANRAKQGEIVRETIYSAINAQRGQLFVGKFEAVIDSRQNVVELTDLEPGRILGRHEFLESCDTGSRVTGAGLKPLADKLDTKTIKVVPQREWICRAANIGKLALIDFKHGRLDNLWELEPFYFRPSYADEKLG